MSVGRKDALRTSRYTAQLAATGLCTVRTRVTTTPIVGIRAGKGWDMKARRVAHRAVAAVFALFGGLIATVAVAPPAHADLPGLVVVVVAEPTGSYVAGFCPDPGHPVLGSLVCSGGASTVQGLTFLSGGGSATVSLPAGHYNAALGTVGLTALGPDGGVDVLAGQVITCTFTMTAGPTCATGGATGTVLETIAEPSGGSFATGFCPDPGLPVAGSGVCSDGHAVEGLLFLGGGASGSAALLPGTYNAAMAEILSTSPTTYALSPIVPVHVLVGHTLACTFTMAAGPVCAADDGDGVVEPSGVDGNGDGIADASQASVATFNDATGTGLLTIAAPDSTYTITGVTNTGAPYTPPPPSGASLPVGVLGFTVTLPSGASTADVQVILPAGSSPTSYFKLHSGTWLDFTSHVTIVGDTVTLHLVDGDPFDADGSVNGVIVDPGFASSGYHFVGFGAPIDNVNANTVRAGQTIPVRWRLTDASGAPVSDPASIVSLTSQPCKGGDEVKVSPVSSVGKGNWQALWKTDKAYKNQCRVLTLTLNDGTSHTASFVFN